MIRQSLLHILCFVVVVFGTHGSVFTGNTIGGIKSRIGLGEKGRDSSLDIWQAIEKTDYKQIRYLLKEKKVDFTQTNKDGDTVLHYAAYVGYPVIEELIEHGADPGVKNKHGKTALHRACDASKIDTYTFKQLVKKSPQSVVNGKNNEGSTCLHYLIVKFRKNLKESKYLKSEDALICIKSLLENKADPNIQNAQGKACLKLIEDKTGYWSGYGFLWLLLLDYGAKDSVFYGKSKLSIIEKFIKDAKENKTSEYKQIYTQALDPFLLFYSGKGDCVMVRKLLDAGADVNVIISNAYCGYKSMPLHNAISKGQHEIVKLLLSRGAKICFKKTSYSSSLENDLLLKTLQQKNSKIAQIVLNA